MLVRNSDFGKSIKSHRITGIHNPTYATLFGSLSKKHIPTCTNSETHIIMYMFFLANRKRKQPLPDSSSWEIPVFHHTGKAVMPQARASTRQRMGTEMEGRLHPY